MFKYNVQAEMNALRQQEQELVAGKEQIVDILSRIEEEKVRFTKLTEIIFIEIYLWLYKERPDLLDGFELLSHWNDKTSD